MIRKLSLISKSLTSQNGQQTVTIGISPSLSRRKSNQTMKLSELRNIISQENYAENEEEKLVSDLFLIKNVHIR